MPLPPPRDRATRCADTLAALSHRLVDAWIASADLGTDGTPRPYLVPLSLAWFEERIVLALEADSRTARGIQRYGTARVGVGPTRDVVLIDAVLEKAVSRRAATGTRATPARVTSTSCWYRGASRHGARPTSCPAGC